MSKNWMAAAIVMLAAGAASAGTIDFNSDPSGGQANGFVSDDSAIVSFSDTVGSGLVISSYAESNNSPAIGVFNDTDGSKLRMDFSTPATALSLDFGNDDPNFSNPGDLAILQLFNGLALVNTVTVVLNRDDLMNQTIAYSGAAFNRADFYYGDPQLSPFAGGGRGIIEIVDNINFTATAVPLPPAAWMGLGLLGLVGVARRRRRS